MMIKLTFPSKEAWISTQPQVLRKRRQKLNIDFPKPKDLLWIVPKELFQNSASVPNVMVKQIHLKLYLEKKNKNV